MRGYTDPQARALQCAAVKTAKQPQADPTWLRQRRGPRNVVNVSMPPALLERLDNARAAGYDINVSRLFQGALADALESLGQ